MLLKSEIYTFEEFQLDANHLMLYRDGKEVPLPPKAVKTLAVLVQNAGEIVKKQDLMNVIWNDSIVEESNLSHYLHVLRKTLGLRSDGTAFIETLKRRGYRFTPSVTVVQASRASCGSFAIDEGELPEISNHFHDGRETDFDENSRGRVPANQIVGREKEIERVVSIISSAGVRLLNLTGIGGVGKTTLAREAVLRAEARFSDGAIFIELAAITDRDGLTSAVLTALGVREVSGRPVFELLLDRLNGKEILLVFDNCEQIMGVAEFVSDLLSKTAVSILMTSRVLIHVKTEHEFVVPPLDMSKTDTSNALNSSQIEAGSCEAVRLFSVRAREARPHFELARENVELVNELCSRLGGLPLAIELAAARVKIMSLEGIRERLNRQLELLSNGRHDLPARQQTMRSTIEWSYSLLNDAERALFRQLSIFSGGFSLDAGAAVNDLSTNDTNYLDLMTSLTDKNLICANEQPNGEVRFRMLEVVREYAGECLNKKGESDDTRHRHANYFLRLTESAEPGLQAAQSAEWLNRLEVENDNIRTAMAWLLVNDYGSAQKMAASIWRFWWVHGHIREGCEQLELALEKSKVVDKTVHLKLLAGAAALNRLSGNSALSQEYARMGLDLAEESGDRKFKALALHQLGFHALDDNDFETAKQLFQEGLESAAIGGDKQVLALLLNGLGEISRSQHDYEGAQEYYERALELNREVGDRVRQTTSLVNLGATSLLRLDVARAGRFYREGLEISSKMVDMNGTIYCLEGLAGSHLASEDPTRAAMIFGAAEAAREMHNLYIEPADRIPYELSIARVRESIKENQFNELFSKGKNMTLERAVEIALSLLPRQVSLR